MSALSNGLQSNPYPRTYLSPQGANANPRGLSTAAMQPKPASGQTLVAVENLTSALDFTQAVYDVARVYGLDPTRIMALVEDSHSLSQALTGDTSGQWTTFTLSGVPNTHMNAFYEALSAKVSRTLQVFDSPGPGAQPLPRVYRPYVNPYLSTSASPLAYQAHYAPYLAA
jgi:hypothetical protein